MAMLSTLFDILSITVIISAGGEPAILFLSFMASATKAPLSIIILVGYLGAVIGEIFWFILARKISVQKIERWKFIKKGYCAFIETVKKIDREKPLRLLFWARSFYGGGIAAIIYLAGTPLSIGKMIQYSMLVNAFWVALFVFLGWGAGKGLQSALELFIDIKIALTIIVVLAILSYLTFYIINKKHKKC